LTSRLVANGNIAARIAEILRTGAERAEITVEQVLRELAKLGFSCIGKAVTWRNEVVTQELEGGEEGETRTVMVPRVTIVPTEDLERELAVLGFSDIGKVVRWRPEVTVYPKYGTDAAARAHGARLVANGNIAARIAEILRAGAERAEITVEQVLRELAKLGFSCIGKAVTWRNEVVTQELEGGEEGETRTVMVPRVTIVPTEDLDKATLDAIAEVSQQANGALRVKMHDKHAALVSLGKHLGLFTDNVQVKAVYGISEEPMSAEEWKRQYVREG
jgi:phage terminase small subunit